MHPIHLLPPEMQESINRQVARIKAEFEIKADLLSLEDLAKVIGKSVNYLWNLRNQGKMLPIPVTRVGGHDTFWVVDVAMWLMRLDGSDLSSSNTLEACSNSPPGAIGKSPPLRNARTPEKKGAAIVKSGDSKQQIERAKAALIEKGMKILEERRRSK